MSMKRLIFVLMATFLFAVLLVTIVPPYQQAEASPHTDIVVLLDDLPLRFDVLPQIKDGRTLVPFRFIAEALGINVNWDGATRTITASTAKTQVLLQINNKAALLNDSEILLDVPPVIVNDRTLVPLRFFSEAFDCQVDWVAETRTVKIISPPRAMTVIGFYALGDARTSSWTNLFGVPFPETATGNTGMVSELALGWYTIDERGNLLTRSPRTAWQRPPGWQDVLAAAQYYNLRTEMVVHEENRDGMLYAVLNDEQAIATLVAAIILEAEHFHGVNINFEGLGLYAQDEEQQHIRDSFTRFVARLAPPLARAGKTLTLTLHPPNSSFRGYDYQALGELADRIIVMAHDYGPKPEPLNRVVQAVKMALMDVPREKLILAISVPDEPPESILSKVRVAKHFRLQGVSLWRLGLLTEEMWDTLEQAIKTGR